MRDAVFANLAAAGAVDPPLRNPERTVHACVMLLFLGWGKFEDKVATSRIAFLVGWWDGESIPPGELRPRPERHVRRRVSNALRTLSQAGLIGYEATAGNPGREGQNLPTITLPRFVYGATTSGPIDSTGYGAATSGPIDTSDDPELRGHRGVTMGPQALHYGASSVAPTEGNLGNRKGGSAAGNGTNPVDDDIGPRAQRLAALAPSDDAASVTRCHRTIEWLLGRGVSIADIDIELDLLESEDGEPVEPLRVARDLDPGFGLVDVPEWSAIVGDDLAEAILDACPGHWRRNIHDTHEIITAVNIALGDTPTDHLVALIRGQRLANPRRALAVIRQALDADGITLPRVTFGGTAR